MATDDSFDASLKRVHIEHSGHPEWEWNVIDGAPRRNLIEEPQALLDKRERQVVLMWSWLNWREHQAFDRSARFLDAFRQIDNGRRFKESNKWKVYIENIAQAGQHLSSEQRVATKFEEVVVNADALHSENVCPNPGQHLLNRSTRCYIIPL